MAERMGANVVRLAEEVLARDLFDPLWPGLTESDWEQDAKLVARAYLWAEAERDRLREALEKIASKKPVRRQIGEAESVVIDGTPAQLVRTETLRPSEIARAALVNGPEEGDDGS